ncbi:MAG TPA: ATP-binding cassette domain-containing protein [Anaerolineales bacterium]|nr:ATP-binding cassette domain-containing protein [Anaerolineales bacterium]
MNVELKDIHKTFGAVRANVGINLTIPAGTIQGILGENGAGKSTLMKILSGFFKADKGEILLDGQPVTIHSPADAIRQGVGMLHQDPLDFPPLRVIDDFILGRKGGLITNQAQATRDFKQLAEQFSFSIDPEAYVDSLTVGERQQLEILRLIWLGAQVLIFDEPTTGISAAQKVKLFAALRLLAQQGKAILFVSHKLEDVEGLCDCVAVLRQGVLIGEAKPPYVTKNLVEMMFGKEISVGERNPCGAQDVTVNLHALSVEDYRLKVRNVNLDVHCGEVIGLAGMEGSGQGLFLRAVAGMLRTVGGKVLINDADLTGRSYQVFKRHGVAFLPAARLEEGMVPGLNLTEHFVLAEESKQFFINWDQGRLLAQKRINEFNVKGTPANTVESLSGGNQQRALLALLRDQLSLLLLEHPTRGLDIESTIYIWKKLKERCKQGTSILFISSDLEEILQYSDRILVFFSGRVTPPLDATGLSIDKLGELIGGKGWPASPGDLARESTSGKGA